MGETDLRQWWMIRIADWLRFRYQGQRVYVSGNLLIYPEEGNNLRHVAPDCFVTLDCDPGFRRTYKVWEEGKPPDVVFEVTSSSTRRQDEFDKPPVSLRGVRRIRLRHAAIKIFPIQQAVFVEHAAHVFHINWPGRFSRGVRGQEDQRLGCVVSKSDMGVGNGLFDESQIHQDPKKPAVGKMLSHGGSSPQLGPTRRLETARIGRGPIDRGDSPRERVP
jgi:hypothetical protein